MDPLPAYMSMTLPTLGLSLNPNPRNKNQNFPDPHSWNPHVYPPLPTVHQSLSPDQDGSLPAHGCLEVTYTSGPEPLSTFDANCTTNAQNRLGGEFSPPEPQFIDQNFRSSTTSFEPSPVGYQQPTFNPGQYSSPFSGEFDSNVFPVQSATSFEYQQNTINSDSYQAGYNGEYLVPGLQPLDFGLSSTFGGPFDHIQQPTRRLEQGQSSVALAQPLVVEYQENAINEASAQNKPKKELESVDLGVLNAATLPDAPATFNDTVHGSKNQKNQEFQCGNRCRSIFFGPHICSYQGKVKTVLCRSRCCSQKFTNRGDFNRHWNTVHGDKKLFDCPIAGCKRVGGKGFSRKDNLTQHRRSVHEEAIKKNPIRFGRS